MKRYSEWFVAGLIGAAIASALMGSLYQKACRQAIQSTLQSMEDSQRYRCVLSAAVLERLETNEPDRAKLLLTREIVSYYRHSLGVTESQDRKKMLEHIEALRGKSKLLNDELAKNPP